MLLFVHFFFQSCQSIFDCPEADVSSEFNVSLDAPFDFVTKAISDLRDKMENVAKAIAEMSETSEKTPLSLDLCDIL